MRYVLILLAILVSGCVLNQPQNFVFYNEVNTSNVSNVTSALTKTIKETPVPRPQAVIVETPAHLTKITCAKFVLPPAGELPHRPVFSDPELQAKMDFDEILTNHIKALEAHVERERKAVVDAHRQWVTSCVEKD